MQYENINTFTHTKLFRKVRRPYETDAIAKIRF